MNRIANHMTFQIHPQGFISGVNMNGISFEFAPRTVRRHEFEVSLYCVSDDELLQELEFALVERELCQAVGVHDCWKTIVWSGCSAIFY
jgi:hypothetical protein